MKVKPIVGSVLRPSARTQIMFAKGMRDLIDEMTRETRREVVGMYRSEESAAFDANDADVYTRTAIELGLCTVQTPVAHAMDASLADMLARLMTRLEAKFSVLFERAASPLTKKMVEATLDNSAATLGRSLKDVSADVTLKMTPRLTEIVDASAAEASALIKRIPTDYLPKVQGDVMRSITTGNGLQDLIPALEKHDVQVRNWAANVARDQTRKVYSNINKVRAQEAGVNKFRWVHSGGGNKPREFHLAAAPAGLNGGIFSFDDPPIIDQRTGERGIPGQLPYCGCTWSPVIELDEDGN